MAPKTKPLLEYRRPIPRMEPYLGKCENFTKKQTEAIAAEMPAYFLSIAGHEGPKGICLFSGSAFRPRTLAEMIGKLKSSCVEWAGKGSEKACKTLIKNLSSEKPTATPAKNPAGDPDFKPYNPHDPNHVDPRKKTFWIKLVDALINGLGFAVAGLVVTEIGSRIFTGKGILHHIKNRKTNGKNDNDDLPKPPRIGGGGNSEYSLPEESWNPQGLPGLSKMVAIAPELSFELFAVRVLKVLGPDAGYDFIMQRGHDFQSLNLLPAAAFGQTVREFAMWDGIDTPPPEVPSAARDLIASGAVYLNQAHVKASIQKFRVESMDKETVVLRSHDGKLFSLPRMKLPASARVRSVVSVNVAALRPAPIRFRMRVPVRVMP